MQTIYIAADDGSAGVGVDCREMLLAVVDRWRSDCTERARQDQPILHPVAVKDDGAVTVDAVEC